MKVYRRSVPSLRIAQVASRSGIPASTLRYYDQIGLVPTDRSSNGYRSYPDGVFDRLRFIDAARTLDLSLDDISTLLRAWENEPCSSVKTQLRPLLTQQLTSVDKTLDTLTELRSHLESARAHLDVLPDRQDRCDPDCAFLLREPDPVACSLGSEHEVQIDRWHTLLAGHRPEPVAGGLRYRLPIAALAQAAELSAAEQTCCPFFSFDISLRQDTFVLTIRTPPAGDAMLAELAGVDLDTIQA